MSAKITIKKKTFFKFLILDIVLLTIVSILVLNGCTSEKIHKKSPVTEFYSQIDIKAAEEMQSEGIFYSRIGNFGQAILKLKEAERIFAKDKNDEKRKATTRNSLKKGLAEYSSAIKRFNI